MTSQCQKNFDRQKYPFQHGMREHTYRIFRFFLPTRVHRNIIIVHSAMVANRIGGFSQYVLNGAQVMDAPNVAHAALWRGNIPHLTTFWAKAPVTLSLGRARIVLRNSKNQDYGTMHKMLRRVTEDCNALSLHRGEERAETLPQRSCQ